MLLLVCGALESFSLRLGKEEMLLTIGDNARQRLKCACRPRFQGPLSSSLKGGNKRTLGTGLCVCANKTNQSPFLTPN